MFSTSSPLILTRVATFIYGGTLFAVTKRLHDFLPVSYLLCILLVAGRETLYNMLCCRRRAGFEALKPRQPGTFKFLAKLKHRSSQWNLVIGGASLAHPNGLGASRLGAVRTQIQHQFVTSEDFWRRLIRAPIIRISINVHQVATAHLFCQPSRRNVSSRGLVSCRWLSGQGVVFLVLVGRRIHEVGMMMVARSL